MAEKKGVGHAYNVDFLNVVFAASSIFLLLSTIVEREPLDAAVHGVRSPNPGVRGLAIEYLDQVLPPAVLDRLRTMIASIPSAGDAPAQSDAPPTATRSSARR